MAKPTARAKEKEDKEKEKVEKEGSPEKPAGFQLGQDLRFQRRSWAVQRVGRALMALVVLAALLGLVGPGPLSRATAGQEERFSVEYDRFLRLQGENSLTLKVAPGTATGDEVRIWLDGGYIREMELQAIVPEPERVESTAERLVLVFPLARPNGGLEAVVDLQPRGIGRVRGAAGLVGGPGVRIAQFVYP